MNDETSVEEVETSDVDIDAELKEELQAAESEAEQETVEESATSDEPPVKPKKPSRTQKYINNLNREKYDLQRQNQAMQEQLARFQQQQQPQAPTMEGMPSLADFNYDESAYQAAVQQHMTKQVQSMQEQQIAQQQYMAQQQQAVREQQALQAKVGEATTKYPDFVQKVNDPSLPPLRELNPAAFQAVVESDGFADVAYYLANNPSEIYRFAELSPVQAVREITKLEARFGSQPSGGKIPAKPPSKVSGKSEAVKDPSKLSTEEWMKWRDSQAQQKR